MIMDIKELTEKYNKKIKSFKFPTVGASESGIQSILNMYPELNNLPEDKLIEKIAIIISDLAFG